MKGLVSVTLALVCAFVFLPVEASPAPCRPVEGAGALLRPGKVVLLGEQHGTAESPAFVLRLACLAAEAGLPARVGIEIAASEQERIDLFLASAGAEADRRALLEGGPWRSAGQYGVTSEAMLGLLEGLRLLREQGHRVAVVPFNQSGAGGGQARDRKMAEHLAGMAGRAEEGVLLVLTGNIHSRIAKGTPWSPDYAPMGFVLSGAISPERITALDVAHRGGTAWLCIAGEPCGSQQLGPRGPAAEGITMNDSAGATRHHGWYQVGEITASGPARAAGKGKEDAPEPD